MQLYKEINDNKVNNMNNIKYYCSTQAHNSQKNLKFSFNRYNLPTNDIVYDIELDPFDYNSTSNLYLGAERKRKLSWFINSCNSLIPNEVAGLLQLGEGFCSPPPDR